MGCRVKPGNDDRAPLHREGFNLKFPRNAEHKPARRRAFRRETATRPSDRVMLGSTLTRVP
jgi:hypothetical protein